MTLDRYRQKRDFDRTPEPSGIVAAPEAQSVAGGGRYVVQRHRARRLHYDFRLEIGGVLVSWAVPKGPTLDAAVKRAAFKVEDHPLDYYDFEGTIPSGEYGAGDVIVWDWGNFEPELTADPAAAVARGELKLVLHGEKLLGRFTIVRTGGRSGAAAGRSDGKAWLLMKKRDDAAVAGWDPEAHPRSVKTGRTNDEVLAGVPAAERSAVGVAVIAARAGIPAPMPGYIEPMTAVLGEAPFSHPDWLFEVKWDGYRVQAHIRDGRTALYTRRGRDAAAYFPELAGPPTWIEAREAIIDGEVVALNAAGEPDFGLLQARRGAGVQGGRGNPATSGLTYAVFDLLYLDGRSLLNEPLETRKLLLRSVVRDTGSVQYASHVVGDGKDFYAAVAARNLEGVVAKLRRSRYESGRRSAAWVKIKRRMEQEFVIGGWTPREDAANDLGALLLGVFEGGTLRPVGKAGTGFDARERQRLLDLMAPLAVAAAPFGPVPRQKGARWVEPRIVARVEFAEWTADGKLRAPVYKGLELDSDPAGVSREIPHVIVMAAPEVAGAPSETAGNGVGEGRVVPAAGPPAARPHPTGPDHATDGATAVEIEALDLLPGAGGQWSIGGRQLKLSNLDKVLWPADGITKRDLIRHYATIAPYLLPYLRERALTLQRYPDGIGRAGFWQKQVPGHAPDWVSCWPWISRSRGDATDYLLADSAAVLAWVANEAAIDIHPSTYRIGAPNRPTWALVDIDPGATTTWAETLVLARLYRTALEHLGVRGFPKLSGQRGIQVWIPIKPIYGFDQTRDWVAALSRTVATAAPALVSWQWEKSRRDGLARLDYTQNAWNKTLVAPYSVRPVAGGAVSAPISWDELDDPELSPGRWTLRTVMDRIRDRGDLFEPALALEQLLPEL
jgi:bifunctional non-homologous end joining protein LigD